MTRTLIFLALFGVYAVAMAGINLRQASKLHDQEAYPWMRHHLVISNIWAAVATLIGAIAVGVLK